MNLRRVRAISRKELIQILRDPRSLAMAIGIPVMLLVLFGYALTLDVDDVPMVGLIAGSGVRGITDAAFREAGLRQRVQYEATHADLIRQLVVAGLGVAIVPQTMAAIMREVTVVPLAGRHRFLTYVCWRRDPTPAARAFVELIRRECLPG